MRRASLPLALSIALFGCGNETTQEADAAREQDAASSTSFDAAPGAPGSDAALEGDAARDPSLDAAPVGDASDFDASAADAGGTEVTSDAGSVGPSRDAESSACGLPIDYGSCDNYYFAYAHDPESGACLRVGFSRCGPICATGNANCFETLAACEAACTTTTPQTVCEGDRELTTVCIECGPAGGCGYMRPLCAKRCDEHADCLGSATPSCSNGLCISLLSGCI